MEKTVRLGSGVEIELDPDARLIRGPEVAFLEAGYAYCEARRKAFDQAQTCTMGEYAAQKFIVDHAAEAVRAAMMLLAPRSPRDN